MRGIGASGGHAGVGRVPVCIRGGSTAAEQTALVEANQFCQGRGQKFVPINTRESGAPFQAMYGPTDYSVTFQCLSPSDPDFCLLYTSRCV